MSREELILEIEKYDSQFILIADTKTDIELLEIYQALNTSHI